MDHQQYKEWLQLFLYDELEGNEVSLLQEHLRSCGECRSELSSLKKFHGVLNEFTPAVATEQAFRDARETLSGTLRSVPQRRSVREWFGDILEPAFLSPFKVILSGVSVFIIGIVLGLFSRPSEPVSTPVKTIAQSSEAIPGDTRITNVRFINSEPSNGEIEFAFDAVKPVRMKGNINDAQIQRVLTHAILNEQNAGVRLASINAVASRMDAPDREIKHALITAMQSDQNPGVRSEALNALRTFPMDGEIKGAFLFVLKHDDNPGIRIAAINYLDSVKTGAQQPDQDFLNVLREKMMSDNNNYIRLRAKSVIEENRQ